MSWYLSFRFSLNCKSQQITIPFTAALHSPATAASRDEITLRQLTNRELIAASDLADVLAKCRQLKTDAARRTALISLIQSRNSTSHEAVEIVAAVCGEKCTTLVS